MVRERTYIMIKPDGVQRGIVGEIIQRFERKGFKLAAMKLAQPSRAHVEQHYADLAGKAFFASLVDYMLSGPVVCMVWEGDGVVRMARTMLGETDPAASMPGSIRGDFAVDIGRNVCHGSDSVASARAEIALWFPEGVCVWQNPLESWVYERAARSKRRSRESGLVVVGLTGGIASGKSSAGKVLQELGAAFVDADKVGHSAYLPGTVCFDEVVAHFGQRVVAADGTVDRKVLGPIVFGDPAQMQALNGIVWPHIRAAVEAKIRAFAAAGPGGASAAPRVIVVEAAIMLEANWDDLVDEIWVVCVDPETQRKRLEARNALTEAQARQRVEAQMSNAEREARADVVLWNDATVAVLGERVRHQMRRITGGRL